MVANEALEALDPDGSYHFKNGEWHLNSVVQAYKELEEERNNVIATWTTRAKEKDPYLRQYWKIVCQVREAFDNKYSARSTSSRASHKDSVKSQAEVKKKRRVEEEERKQQVALEEARKLAEAEAEKLRRAKDEVQRKKIISDA